MKKKKLSKTYRTESRERERERKKLNHFEKKKKRIETRQY